MQLQLSSEAMIHLTVTGAAYRGRLRAEFSLQVWQTIPLSVYCNPLQDYEPGKVAYMFNPNTQKAQIVGSLWVQGQTYLHNKFQAKWATQEVWG